MNFKKTALLLMCISLSLGAKAQTQSTAAIDLSLEKAVEIALNENPTIKVAEREILRAQYVIKEGQAALLPTVDASLSYNRNLALPVMFMPDGIFGEGTGGAMSMGFKNGYSGALNASLPIYMASIYRNIALTKEQLVLSVENARSSRINMVNEVKSAYYNVLIAQKTLMVLNENKEVLETNVKDIQAKFEKGMASEYDLLTAQVQLQNLLPNIDKSKSAVEISIYMVKVLLSLPQDIELSFSDSLGGLRANAGATPTTSSIDLRYNSDLNLLSSQIRLQEHAYSLSRANRLPSVYASFNYTQQTQSDDFKIGQYNWAGSSYVAVGVSIPIFTGMKNKYKDQQIKFDIQNLEENKSYAERQIGMQASNVISEINSAKSQILSSEVALEQAKKAYSIATTRYNVGAGTILELNSSQVALMQAELNLNQAIYDMLGAYNSLDKILGKDTL